MSGINVQSLTKIYGAGENEIRALNDVSFNIDEGAFTVILGASGSGKSTLLNILGGMDSATSGSVEVFGKNITSLSDKSLTLYRRSDVGFVFQFYNLMPSLTALENVQLSECEGILNSAQALELVGLNKRLNNFPAQLSGGEQQRVSIARAIVKSPKLLLCDEPTGALDSKTGKSVIELLLALSREKKQSVVVVTHNSTLAQLADRVICLSDGVVVQNKTQEPLNAQEIDW